MKVVYLQTQIIISCSSFWPPFIYLPLPQKKPVITCDCTNHYSLDDIELSHYFKCPATEDGTFTKFHARAQQVAQKFALALALKFKKSPLAHRSRFHSIEFDELTNYSWEFLLRKLWVCVGGKSTFSTCQQHFEGDYYFEIQQNSPTTKLK